MTQFPESVVPQVSRLGPLFLLVFINDLPSCVMSATFGYADDNKIVGDNPLTLYIDVGRLWRWCEENCMSMNLTNSKVLCIKGSATIALPNYSFETTEVMKDLGILITETLSWTQHAKKRAEKALNALFVLKRNLSKANFATRKNAYICYVVPILCYGSAIWKPSKGDLGIIESVQRKAIPWIFMTSNSHISYKDKLVKLNILPLSLYQELHGGQLFAKTLAGKVDIDWRSHVSITDVINRRVQMTRNFVCKQMRLKKCESDFWFRAFRLANLYNEYLKCDILFSPECKNILLGMFTNVRYNESDTCTWRILCECNNCRDLKKLTLISEN